MSGQPSSDRVKFLKKSLREYAFNRFKIRELTASIAEQKASLAKRENELLDCSRDIKRQMEEMDVSVPGNAGWESRHFELLLFLSED